VRWHRIELPTETQLAAIGVRGERILVARAEDRWYAVEDRCSHAGCAFSTDGELDGTNVICNCHGSEFDLRTGEVLVPPAFDPIRTFRVRVTDGRLEVEL
jgi:nitrite reductase/ring-hydroxylating ferredoxin subunit